MSGFAKHRIDFMRRACLLCDNSSLEVRTGCLIVRDGKVLGEGWNVSVSSLGSEGSIGGLSEGVGEVEKVRHAEKMAVDRALSLGVSLRGSMVYVTRFPCERCSKLLVGEGVSRIFYMSDHFSGGNKSLGFLLEEGLSVAQIPESLVWR